MTPIKVQLGPIANGLITGENFAASAGRSPGGRFSRYGERAVAAKIDPLGSPGPFAIRLTSWAAGGGCHQEPRSDRLAEYMHKASFDRVGRLLA